MKEIDLRLFQPSRWMTQLGKSAFLVLFALCFTGLQSLEAQIVLPVGVNNKTVQQKIETCAGASVQFTDDNSGDNTLYADFANSATGAATTNSRSDTVEICPQDRWHFTTVTFTEFDIDNGDFLKIFDASLDTVRVRNARSATIPTASGTAAAGINGSGVSNANGGWVAASCDPDVNNTGCLTFVFETTADNEKGTGWDAWVTCADRGVTLTASAPSQKLVCTDADGLLDVTLNFPTVRFAAACGTLTPSVTLVVKSQTGATCHNSVETGNVTLSNLAVGTYVAEWFLTNDASKTTGPLVFSISLPALVCNDDVEVPLSAGCNFEIKIDDILENPCDTSVATYLAYQISLKFGEGKNAIITGTATNSISAWPELTKAMLQDYATKTGQDLAVCGATAEVTIERIYTPPTGASCNSGAQRDKCSTTVTFTDNIAPSARLIDFADVDTLIACDAESVKGLLKFGAVDNCQIRDTVVTVTFEETDPCFDSNGKFGPDTTQAFIVVTATDMCGNVGTFNDTAMVIRPSTFADPMDHTFECSDAAGSQERQLPGLRVGRVRNGVTEIRDTIYTLSTTDYACGYILIADEQPVPGTDCGRKELIEWSVVDWCNPAVGPSVVDTQFITYTDRTAPLFLDTLAARKDVNGNDVKVLTVIHELDLPSFECTLDAATIPVPVATDNCDANPEVAIDSIYRVEDGSLWPIASTQWAALDCDSFLVRWVASDDCHEQQQQDAVVQYVNINDVTLPSAACVDQLNVSLASAEGAIINVSEIDAGSYDACGIRSTLIRIKDSGDAWAETVTITCEFVHPDLQIEMQVIDNKGNENICWLDIVVEDKINPICSPLDNVVDDCDEYHNGELGASTDADGDGEMEDAEYQPLTGNLLDFYNVRFGNPALLGVCEDNLDASCGDLTFEQQYQLLEWPCGEMRAKRRYRATDWSGLSSAWVEQVITVEYRADWSISFPQDWEGSCGDIAPAESIVVNNGPCDLLGFEVTERQFEVPGDACFKIERTYHVINWCTYVAGNPPVELLRFEDEHGVSTGLTITSEGRESEGYWTYVQVLKVHDDEAPVVTVIDPEPCIDGVEFDAPPYGEEDQTPGAAPFECDEEKTWRATATDCSNNISWTGRLYNAATGALVKEVASNELTYIVSNKESFFAEFWAFDGCGNSAGERGADVLFWDCKKPTPYVLNGVAVELMQTGMVQVWATDLNQNSFDNCTDQADLDFRIWADFMGTLPSTDEEVAAVPSVITFDCDRVGTNVIYIFVIDEEGNWDVVQTYVIIQDNMINCANSEPTGMVAGSIVNPNGENVESVVISVEGASQETATTGADGNFAFVLNRGEDYTLTPTKDINPLNGVSTFDLVLISKHILGITPFDSPYKHIAADVNRSGSITAFDMVQLRQLILNITDEFPSNDSWRFVDAAHQFTSANPANENFGEFYSIAGLNNDMDNLDFIGVKVGDVNGNARANSLVSAEARTVKGALTFNIADRFVEAGQDVEVTFAANTADAQGYQFTLNFAGLELTNVEEGLAKAENFNTNLANRGLIATSWNGEAANDAFFTLKFKATQTGLLSELISVSSDITVAEAYNTAGELLDVAIDFTTAAGAAQFQLNQNTPNPFNAETVIGFTLPQAGTATLKVMDVQGKVLQNIKGDFVKGYNTVTVNAKALGATGVLYYQLESADKIATKKMIIIE